VKTSFGYIGITFLSVLWSLIILNDSAKLLNECYKETKDLLEERRGKMKDGRKENEIEQVKIELEQEEKNAQDLDEKLEKIHSQLIKEIAAKKANRKRKK
jgi:septation ring formation regulator EzrA